MSNSHPTKCAAFYNHFNIRGGNRVFPCCRFKKSVKTFNGDLFSILNSEEYKTLRAESETTRLPECGKCWHEEDLGKKSLRQWFNENYSTDRPQLKYLEIGFDNICNLTCDGCWEEWSHSWWSKKNPESPIKMGITDTEEIEFVPSTIEKVVFLGGEPLMTNRHRQFLEKFESLENLTVEYFTNGMFALKAEDHKLLEQCKAVKFTVSVDGFGKLNESVRSGSDWKTVAKNTKKLSSKYNVTVHSVIHKNNWHGILDLFKWTDQNSYNWTTNILTFPPTLDISTLDNESKDKIIKICNSYDIPNKEYIKSHLQETIVE